MGLVEQRPLIRQPIDVESNTSLFSLRQRAVPIHDLGLEFHLTPGHSANAISRRTNMQLDKPPRAASEPPNRIERYPCECDWHTRPSTRARSRCRATLARLVVRLLVGTDGAITVAVDDTLFTRRRPKVRAASWFHDAPARGDRKVGCGNNWVIAAVAVRLALLDRPVALPVAFALIRKDSLPRTPPASTPPAGSSTRWPPRCPAGASTWSPTPPTPARHCGACRPR